MVNQVEKNAELRRMGGRSTLLRAAANEIPLAANFLAPATPVGFVLGAFKAGGDFAAEYIYQEKNEKNEAWRRVKQISALVGSAGRAAAPFLVLGHFGVLPAVGTVAVTYLYEAWKQNKRLAEDERLPDDPQNNLIPSVTAFGVRRGLANWWKNWRD